MNGLFVKLVLTITSILFSLQTMAGWSRTDSNSRLIKTASKNLEKQLKNNYEKYELEEDWTSLEDDHEELSNYAEINLADAYQTIIYWAYKSPNQKRYLNRVKKNVTKRQMKQIQRIIKVLDRMWKPNDDTKEAYIADYIEEASENLARKEIRKAKRASKAFYKSIAADKLKKTKKPGA